MLVECQYDEANFGNAQAVFELGELRLHFLNDRGFETVDIEIPDGQGGSAVVPLENLAVAANWLSLEKLLCHYGLSDAVAESRSESDPPPGPFLALDGALSLIGQGWDQLVEACASKDVLRNISKAQKLIQDSMADSFSIGHDDFQRRTNRDQNRTSRNPALKHRKAAIWG